MFEGDYNIRNSHINLAARKCFKLFKSKEGPISLRKQIIAEMDDRPHLLVHFVVAPQSLSRV